jgi:cation diffusion facilitator family transporter
MTGTLHETWRHAHIFDAGNDLAERSTRRVVILAGVMMLVEIIAGWRYNSMALLSDGWHMSSHVVALGLSALAYTAARRFADDPRFSFGTWKLEVLGGYTSAIVLVGVAGMMVYESSARILSPSPIQFDQAIPVAVVGLLVNLASAWMLKDAHHHGGEGHHHDHHHDLNLRSAYLHVAADAATSVLAIVALVAGKMLGYIWLDPVMGIAGALVIALWSYGLIRETGKVLLDADMTNPVVEEIREALSQAPFDAKLFDLHVWRVGKGKFACIVGVTTNDSITPEDVRKQLRIHEELVHITVEINRIDMPQGGTTT